MSKDLKPLVARIRELLAAATPGPYRAHDHNDMAKVGEAPADWIGYGWVGRITKSSEPDGRFDAGWLNADRRKDGSKEYRERASADVHFVAEALNALPTLLDALEAAWNSRNPDSGVLMCERSNAVGAMALAVWNAAEARACPMTQRSRCESDERRVRPPAARSRRSLLSWKGRGMSAWQDIRTAPVNREVEIRVGRRKFRAILVSDGSLNEDEQPCDQWQATTENHPRDWCDGCCWESNSNGLMSAPPEAWRELPGASA